MSERSVLNMRFEDFRAIFGRDPKYYRTEEDIRGCYGYGGERYDSLVPKSYRTMFELSDAEVEQLVCYARQGSQAAQDFDKKMAGAYRRLYRAETSAKLWKSLAKKLRSQTLDLKTCLGQVRSDVSVSQRLCSSCRRVFQKMQSILDGGDTNGEV